ncbi:MAG: aminoacyl-histidine dipeptidase [Blautia sp.]|nr:aminoacyl-histidine dipeptidase [Blautia sp.]
MEALNNYKPERVLYYFEEICKIPHGSSNTKQISDYLVSFARSHDLKHMQDDWNNVLIKKPGTPGYEKAPTIILQGHMDMVCAKDPKVIHDFTKDPLHLTVTEDGYIKAEGTTLGGDDGIAIAYGLALLESSDIPHPPLEVLFTVDEEIGLLGADSFDCSVLKGKRMINLDSEEEGSIWVSCAGGLSMDSLLPVHRMKETGLQVEIVLSGLTGGHSGAEIDKNRANANKLMGEFLFRLKEQMAFGIADLYGGEKDNAISRNAGAILLIDEDDHEDLYAFASRFQDRINTEYAGTDENITVSINSNGLQTRDILLPVSAEKVIFYLIHVPYGIVKMSGTIPGLVETSMNPGVMSLNCDAFRMTCSVRSSLNQAKEDLKDKVIYLTEFLGGECRIYGSYPAWQYRKDSPLRDKMVSVYEDLYHNRPNVVAIHAGLECGLFYEKIDGLDCVSIGPNMKDIHTPGEALEIASVERVWEYLKKCLKELKS